LVTLLIPFCFSIHGLRSFSSDRICLLDTIVSKFYGPQLANAEQRDNGISVAPRQGRPEASPCCKDARFERTPGSYWQRAHRWQRPQRRHLWDRKERNYVGPSWK